MAGDVATLSTELHPSSQVMPQLEERPKATTTSQEAPILRIDPEFSKLIPPLTSGELEKLKESLSDNHGCRDKLIVWKGHNTLLDGHHRYQICQEKGLRFETSEIDLPSRTHAKIWILKNQRGRRNLNESQRAMLAVTLESIYSEQAKERIGIKGDSGKNFDQEEAGRSAEKAAKDMGVSRQSVAFAKKVATKGIPEIKQMVDTTILAVSTASKVADLNAEDQIKVQAEINKKAQEKAKDENITSRVTNSEVAWIINKILSEGDKKSDTGIDENLANVEQKLNRVIKKLSGVETTTNPEKLAELIALGEKILEIIRAIELKSQSIIEKKEDLAPSQEPEKEPRDGLRDGPIEESRRKEVHIIPARIESEGDTILQADQGAISN